MKKSMQALIGSSMMIVLASPALAVDTTRTYNSGILVGLFLGFCALVVVVQLVPTIILLYGFIKGVIKGTDKKVSHRGSKV